MCIDDDARPLKSKDLEERARQIIEELKADGHELHPVAGSGRNLVKTFWAKAWMKHLGQSEIYGMRLAPGRTYLRHGCVIDLSITQGRIEALVAGERLYEVGISVKTPDDEQLEKLRSRNTNNISSWVDVLQGKLSDNVLALLCREDSGILPDLTNIRCSCTCPDWADLCKHSAAALYAVGVKLDESPELLFILRNISWEQIKPDAPENDSPHAAPLQNGDVSSLFGIDIDE